MVCLLTDLAYINISLSVSLLYPDALFIENRHISTRISENNQDPIGIIILDLSFGSTTLVWLFWICHFKSAILDLQSWNCHFGVWASFCVHDFDTAGRLARTAARLFGRYDGFNLVIPNLIKFLDETFFLNNLTQPF